MMAPCAPSRNLLQRLGLEHIDILYIHDADVFTHGPEKQKVYFKQAMEGCYPALLKLRDQGVVKAIGVGVNDKDVMLDFMRQGDFDCLLMAGRYTLLEQEPWMNSCRFARNETPLSSSAAA